MVGESETVSKLEVGSGYASNCLHPPVLTLLQSVLLRFISFIKLPHLDLGDVHV